MLAVPLTAEAVDVIRSASVEAGVQEDVKEGVKGGGENGVAGRAEGGETKRGLSLVIHLLATGAATVEEVALPPSKGGLVEHPTAIVRRAVKELLERDAHTRRPIVAARQPVDAGGADNARGAGDSMDSILDTLPRKYEWLGDMVVLPAGAFCGEPWEGMGGLWDCIAEALGARRILRAGSRRRGEGGVQETERRRET
jgi:hypothetical protein